MIRTIVGYSMIVEVIFSWPGLGFQLVNSVLQRDYTLAQMLALLLAAVVIVANFLADVGHRLADPADTLPKRTGMSDTRFPNGMGILVETPGNDAAIRYALLREGFSSLRRSKVAMLGGLLVAVFFVVGIVGAVLLLVPSWQHLYLQQNLSTTLEPPLSKGHILGTDTFGRDMAWRVIAGTGISLFVGVTMAISSVVIGFVLGSIAGYFRAPPTSVSLALWTSLGGSRSSSRR